MSFANSESTATTLAAVRAVLVNPAIAVAGSEDILRDDDSSAATTAATAGGPQQQQQQQQDGAFAAESGNSRAMLRAAQGRLVPDRDQEEHEDENDLYNHEDPAVAAAAPAIDRQRRAVENALALLNTYCEALLHAQPTSVRQAQFDDLLRNHFPLSLLLNYLNPGNPESVWELTVQVLKKVFVGWAPDAETAAWVKPFVIQGFHHPYVGVRTLSILQLSRIARVHSNFLDDELITLTMGLLADPLLPVAQQATAMLLDALGHEQSGGPLLSPRFQQTLLALFAKDAVVKMRCYEAIMQAGLQSEQTALSPALQPFTDALVRDLTQSSDILLQVNLVELAGELLITPAGNRLAEKLYIHRHIIALLQKSSEDPFLSFLVPSGLKYLAKVAAVPSLDFPKFLDEHPQIFPLLFQFMTGTDMVSKQAAIDTLGCIGSTSSGFELIRRADSTAEGRSLLKAAFGDLLTPSPDLHNCVMNAFASVILGGERVLKTGGLSHDQMRAQSALLSRLFKALPGVPSLSATKAIFDYARQPFQDVRFAAFNVLYAIAAHSWGQQELATCPGLLEHLLNRATETSKEGSEWKFNIIQRLARPVVIPGDPFSATTLFGGAVYQRIHDYIAQGPFAAQGTMAVSTLEA